MKQTDKQKHSAKNANRKALKDRDIRALGKIVP